MGSVPINRRAFLIGLIGQYPDPVTEYSTMAQDWNKFALLFNRNADELGHLYDGLKVTKGQSLSVEMIMALHRITDNWKPITNAWKTFRGHFS